VDLAPRVPRDYKIRGHTIGQSPNRPLWVVFAALLASLLTDPGTTANHVARAVLYVALSIWACEEAVRGVNRFRQAVGVLALVLLVAALARALG
jgi:hypothetical protein